MSFLVGCCRTEPWKRVAEFCKHGVLRSGDNCNSWRERGRLLIAFVRWTGPVPSSVTRAQTFIDITLPSHTVLTCQIDVTHR